MTYSKDQIWDMTADEANEAFFQQNIVAYYKNGTTVQGFVDGIICANNSPHLPCNLKLASCSRSILLLDDNLLNIKVIK